MLQMIQRQQMQQQQSRPLFLQNPFRILCAHFIGFHRVTPFPSAVCLASVTVGIPPCTPSASVPSFITRRKFGSFTPCSSACVTYSGFSPSTETITSMGIFSWAPRGPPRNKTTAKAVRKRREAEVLERTAVGLVIAGVAYLNV